MRLWGQQHCCCIVMHSFGHSCLLKSLHSVCIRWEYGYRCNSVFSNRSIVGHWLCWPSDRNTIIHLQCRSDGMEIQYPCSADNILIDNWNDIIVIFAAESVMDSKNGMDVNTCCNKDRDHPIGVFRNESTGISYRKDQSYGNCRGRSWRWVHERREVYQLQAHFAYYRFQQTAEQQTDAGHPVDVEQRFTRRRTWLCSRQIGNMITLRVALNWCNESTGNLVSTYLVPLRNRHDVA